MTFIARSIAELASLIAFSGVLLLWAAYLEGIVR